jgi:hypothetical protein
MDQPRVGNRITWNVYGRQYTGRITRIVEGESEIYEKGDKIVTVDGKPEHLTAVVRNGTILPD